MKSLYVEPWLNATDFVISSSYWYIFIIFQDQNPAASDWQVTFHKAEELLKPMNLSEARKQGYLFDLTDRRIVFRTPYGQPYSSSLEVNCSDAASLLLGIYSKTGADSFSLGERCSSRGHPCNSVLQTKLGFHHYRPCGFLLHGSVFQSFMQWLFPLDEPVNVHCVNLHRWRIISWQWIHGVGDSWTAEPTGVWSEQHTGQHRYRGWTCAAARCRGERLHCGEAWRQSSDQHPQ